MKLIIAVFEGFVEDCARCYKSGDKGNDSPVVMTGLAKGPDTLAEECSGVSPEGMGKDSDNKKKSV